MKTFKIELFDGHDKQYKYDRISTEVTEDYDKVKILYCYELTGYSYSQQQRIDWLGVGERLYIKEEYMITEKSGRMVTVDKSQAITRIT